MYALMLTWNRLGFEVLAATSMKIAVLRAVIRAIAQMIEAASTSETSVNFYQTTNYSMKMVVFWVVCNNPEDSHLHEIV
jgi:hypothetical protein